mgnify:CR=1 FL=1
MGNDREQQRPPVKEAAAIQDKEGVLPVGNRADLEGGGVLGGERRTRPPGPRRGGGGEKVRQGVSPAAEGVIAAQRVPLLLRYDHGVKIRQIADAASHGAGPISVKIEMTNRG